ncbi:hypothetical protein CHGG_03277 [Chaetomium globosum CBS 148.51]|uniref:PUM-HD domain-containing protein n=1 Tax=Chaetomium globosum (strain ATCC 6205 / CBS 148.51 / DSM 1962 / NBRC 6347 / NRRL 1970) TaxID=306901 RepID=Q2H927_CHAGB|nr:uncharacterized protein CHGG_03277 [Chaetomium globosum CBS 148.51]EAQ91342.1 hypothetical protein CHGG_03277 [Chaetomium globosum CBS 148.51]
MATNSRRSRLSDYGSAPTDSHTFQPGLGNSIFNSPASGPWNNNTVGPFANTGRVVAPKDAKEFFASAGLGIPPALETAVGHEAWRTSYWVIADSKQARTLPDTASPRGRSDASLHDPNQRQKFFHSPPAMTQRGPIGSKPTTAAAVDGSKGAFKYPLKFSSYADEGEDGQSSNQSFEHRFAALPASLNAVGSGPSRKSISGLAEPDLPTQADSFNDFAFGIPTLPSMHSQRPSIDESSLPTHPGMGSFDNAAQNFQFNPVSQPWDNGNGYGNGFVKDGYPNGTSLEKRGSIAGRNSPAGSTYRNGGSLNSPRSFTGATQPNPDGWSRPTSRDPGLAAELARRGLTDQFAQHPASGFFPNTIFPQNYQQYPPPYAAYLEPAHNAHLAGYPVPTPYSFAPTGVPTRPARDQDPGKSLRSVLLHEFKHSPKSKKWELKDIWSHVVEFSGDQQASRFIQQKLETANSDERDQVFAEIEPNAVQLMKDVFGNYVMQKLFEYGDQVQKKVLANAMKGKVVDLSMQPYACRVVQKAFEHILVDQQTELVKELESEVIKVAKDQHGNHVIQQAIVLVPREHIDCMMAGLNGHIYELAAHQYGCRVVQRVLERGTETDKAAVMSELHDSAELLITDMYGNYVIQHVLEKGRPEDRGRMISVITPQLLTLSRHKNASNVVEKCILLGTPEEQRSIRDQLMGDDANKKLVRALQGEDRAVLVNKLASHLQSLRQSGATNKQIEAMDRLVADSQAPASVATSHSHNFTPASTTPTSPGLHVDVSSVAPTPNLTMDPSSPLSTPSSGPPYLNGDTNESMSGQPAGKETTHSQ